MIKIFLHFITNIYFLITKCHAIEGEYKHLKWGHKNTLSFAGGISFIAQKYFNCIII